MAGRSLPSEDDIASGQLLHVWLSGVQFTEHSDFDLERERVTYSVEEAREVVSDADDAATLRFGVTVRWRDAESGDDRAGPFALSVEASGHFHGEEGVDPDDFRAWVDFNGPYLLWPYVRMYIGTLTSQSRFPPLTIFTLQLPQPLLDAETGEFDAASEPRDAAG